MYQCGDQVLYSIHGVCTIVGIEKRIVDRKTVEYYVLEPDERSADRYYIPIHNEIAVGKLRKILSRADLDALLNSDEVKIDAWIEDENLRKQRYRQLIAGGDRVALLQMVNTLHNRRKQILDAGKKFHLCDENFLKDAQKLLTSEFSTVLDISANEVADYVLSATQK